MDEQLSLLIQLQEIDGNIRTLAAQKKKLPEALADLECKRTASQAELESSKEALLAAQKNKRDRDQDLEAGVQKVEKLKTRSSEIKNNKEYQALLKEIETGELENKTIEDDIISLMEKIDVASAAIKAAEQRLREEEVSIQAEQKQHEADFAKIEIELHSVEQARGKIASQVQPTTISLYEKLLKTKDFP